MHHTQPAISAARAEQIADGWLEEDASGRSTREADVFDDRFSKHLEETYGVEVGRDTVSRVTDAGQPVVPGRLGA